MLPRQVPRSHVIEEPVWRPPPIEEEESEYDEEEEEIILPTPERKRNRYAYGFIRPKRKQSPTRSP